MHVKGLKLNESINNLDSGLCIDGFLPISLIVGSQGSGKSTILSAIAKNNESITLELSSDVIKNGISNYYFDFEKDNPRTKDTKYFHDSSGCDVGIGVGNALLSRFKSHGEVLVKYSVEGINKASDCVCLFDEPESGLSLKNQFRLVDAVNNAADRNVQLFIVTHNFLLIESQDTVYSMDEKEWVSSDVFIQSNYPDLKN